MATPSPLQALSQAVETIFRSWTALQLVIEHHPGGAEPARQLRQSTVTLITSSPLCSLDKLIDFFYEQFDRMHTDIEDGSPEQVARRIIHIRDAASSGDVEPAMKVIQAGTTQASGSVVAKSVRGVNSDERDGGAFDEPHANVPRPPHQPRPAVVDDDGFTQVVKGRHR